MPTGAADAVVDIRGLESAEAWERIVAFFDALAAGGSLEIVGQPQSWLLRRLQEERKGLFEWSPLGNGPVCFRTRVTRRAAAAGALREVAEALAWDHDRLDGLDRHAFELLAAGDARGAELAWADFVVGLLRHIRFEEELLFPVFEEKLGLSPEGGPTAVMRAEHRDIERLVEEIGLALAGGADAWRPRRDLLALLGGHNLKEERVLYPQTDRLLSPEESDALVARIQAS